MIKASVVIPVYNQSERVKLVLKAFNWQSIDRDLFEVILVNDASTDGLEDVVEDLEIEYTFRLVTLEENSGRANARNAGVLLAENELIIFSDGDRIPHHGFVENHIKSHRESGKNSVVVGEIVELFISDYEKRHHELSEFTHVRDLTKSSRLFNYADCVYTLYDQLGNTDSKLAWLTLLTGNCSISKELHSIIGGFDSNFVKWGFEDTEYGYRLQEYGANFRLSRQAINYHVYHTSDRSNLGKQESFEYFQRKFDNVAVSSLLPFLSGTLSLQEYGSLVGDDSTIIANEDAIYFNASKYGKRYRL